MAGTHADPSGVLLRTSRQRLGTAVAERAGGGLTAQHRGLAPDHLQPFGPRAATCGTVSSRARV